MSDRLSDVERFLADYAYLSEYLETAQQKYREGNHAVILMALHQCMLLKREPPEWLRLAFIEAYEAALAPVKKGAHLDAERDYAELRFPVALAVLERKPGQNIDDNLFEKIGKTLKIGKTKVKKIYYERGGKELYEMLALIPRIPHP